MKEFEYMSVVEIKNALVAKSSALKGEYKKEYQEEPILESDICLL